jgi:hypothetical protein
MYNPDQPSKKMIRQPSLTMNSISTSSTRSSQSSTTKNRSSQSSRRRKSSSSSSSRTQQQVRNQYLHKLGIQNKKNIDLSNARTKTIKTLSESRFQESLKGDHRSEWIESRDAPSKSPALFEGKSPSSVMVDIAPQTQKKKGRRISFEDSVVVCPIPRRDAYSRRIQSQMWSSAIDIYDNANRNVAEFAAENWDWRQVAEEDSFFICMDTGEKIHPVHAHLYSNITTPQELERNRCRQSRPKESFLQLSRRMASS